VLFNSELVRRVGGNPARLPTDWPGIFALAKKINAIGLPIIGASLEHDGGAFTFLALLGSFGGHVLSPDEKNVAFDGPEGLKALQILRGFGESGQGRADLSRDQARQAFGAGGIGVYGTMSSTILKQEKAAAGRFDVLSIPFPITSFGAWLPAAGPVAIMLTHDPAKQRAAFELMKFAASPRGQAILETGSGYAPVNELASATAHKNANAYRARLNIATSWYAFPGRNSVRITDLIKNRLQQVVTLKESPETALRAMAREVQDLLPNRS
jgi:multiple sugar transport system substrate-binding protein